MVLIGLEALAMPLNATDSVVVKRAELRVDVVGGLRRTVFADTHDDGYEPSKRRLHANVENLT